MGRSWRGWMTTMLLVCGGCSAPPQDDVVWLAEDGRVWCYRTLADADCFTRPERGAEARLIAIGPRRSFVPAPAPDEATVRLAPATPVGGFHGPVALGRPADDTENEQESATR